MISTAYLPPVEYFSLISKADGILIEREENYLKQTYRNRCYILSSHGPQLLSVPVYLGSQHKTLLKEIRIDYSKRWQQVHLRALIASYGSSPYFQYYFEDFEKTFSMKHELLFDLNMNLIELILKMLKMNHDIELTTHFDQIGYVENDYRYSMSPKKESAFHGKEYMQVFGNNKGFVTGMSIVDLIFNMGPEAIDFL